MLKKKLENLLKEATAQKKLDSLLLELGPGNQTIQNIDKQNSLVRWNKSKAKLDISKGKLLQAQVELRTDPRIVQDPGMLMKKYQSLKVKQAETKRAEDRVDETANLARKKSQETQQGGDPLTWKKN
jgi:hypothetical protein